MEKPSEISEGDTDVPGTRRQVKTAQIRLINVIDRFSLALKGSASVGFDLSLLTILSNLTSLWLGSLILLAEPLPWPLALGVILQGWFQRQQLLIYFGQTLTRASVDRLRCKHTHTLWWRKKPGGRLGPLLQSHLCWSKFRAPAAYRSSDQEAAGALGWRYMLEVAACTGSQ